MNRLKNIIALGAFSLLLLALPSIASAQYRDRDDDYYGNSRYGNIRGTIQSLKNKARNLEERSDRYNDRRNDRYDDRYNDGNARYRNSGSLEQLTDRFRNATGDLERAYGRGRNLNNSADEARKVLDLGSQIEQELSRSRGSRNLRNQWGSIRNDLGIIANAYNMNNRGSGNWRNRVPFPLPF